MSTPRRPASKPAPEQAGANSAPLEAVFAKDTEVLRAAILAGCDVDCVDGGGETPAIKAARRGNIESLRLLIEAGADVSIPTPCGHTALCYASNRMDIEWFAALRDGGADLDHVGGSGWRPLALAIAHGSHGSFEPVLWLLNAGCSPNRVDGEDIGPAQRACVLSQKPNCRTILEALAAAGADLGVGKDGRNRPLSDVVESNGWGEASTPVSDWLRATEARLALDEAIRDGAACGPPRL